MDLRTVLYIMDIGQPEDDCRTIVESCRRMNAHLSILLVKPAPPLPFNNYPAMIADGWVEQQCADMAELAVRRKGMEGTLAREHVALDVDDIYSEYAAMGAIAATRARCADITLMHRKVIQYNGVQWPALIGVLFDSTSPLLLLPDNEDFTFEPKTILLAWDGRIEAARAARSALPFLKRAQTVHLTLVDPEPRVGDPDLDRGGDIATYLARHHVCVTVDELPAFGQSISQVLLRHARDIAADLIVMGAYGHSRLRERIFGGVTKAMLEDATMPLFIAH
ncbi:universal stress protein [Methylovirgula sp. 4M-Z18]|uniref:universal stress protein n=1 Tax=Methylovirgula sp. 4M-Z18 TaxID=2293567 RepID=UPI0013140D3C|nr:universal stress protein [Methylovirgula sp. 4M-Z18]